MQVHFTLKASVQLSAIISPDFEDIIRKAAEEANNVIFRKGVPSGIDDSEIGRITGITVKENYIEITIESGTYTRVHDALFRFRKYLAQILGKYRVGVRGIEVHSYDITATLDSGVPVPNLSKLPFVKSARNDENKLIISLSLSASDLENKVPDRILRLIEEKAEASQYGGKGEHWDLIFESEQKNRSKKENPTDEMLAKGWIKHGLSRGQWIYGPEAVRLFRAFERLVMEKIIGPLGFTEMIFPKLVPWEVWMKSGHAKGVYPEIYYVSVPKTRDPLFWEEVSDYFKVTGEVPVDLIRDKIDGPIGGLCYAQCPSFWPFLQGETLTNDCLPAKIFDRSGTSHRYESGGIHGIERVDEFHRIEILWLGTPEETVAIAESLHEAYKKVFIEIMELDWRCARVTPWFMAQEGLLGDVKETGTGCCSSIGTTDYEAFLPYNETWLEFQNVSINGDKYPKGFNVKIQSGSECWSGCSGIGLERWTAAFLAQKGLDMAGWPELIKEYAGREKSVFKFC